MPLMRGVSVIAALVSLGLLLGSCDAVQCPHGTVEVGGGCRPAQEQEDATVQAPNAQTTGGDGAATSAGTSGIVEQGGASGEAQAPVVAGTAGAEAVSAGSGGSSAPPMPSAGAAGIGGPAGAGGQPNMGLPAGGQPPAAGAAGKPADPCMVCDPRAMCIVSAGQASCMCPAPFIGDGKTCRLTTCSDLTCDPQAICSASSQGAECRCKAGYTGDGKRCTDIDECSTERPCGANATCTNQPGKYACKCNTGFQGDGVTCTRIDYCQPNPCGSGRCTALADRAACDCSGTDFGGTLCDQQIDDCASRPCLNGGTCVDGVRSFKCQCARHWKGERCQTEICEGVNCSPGFVCTPVTDSDPGAGNAGALCTAPCYPRCASGQQCIRDEDCTSRFCDFNAGGTCR